MTFHRRAVFDADHGAFRDSVSRFLAGGAPDGPDFLPAAVEYGFVGLGAGDVEDPRFAAVVLEEAMTAGLPTIALSLAMHDGFALPLLGEGDAPPLIAVVDSDSVRADPAGDGWRLRGAATAVVNGWAAKRLVVVARTDAGSEVVLSVSGAAPGLTREPSEALLGLDGLDLGNVLFDGVSVGAADRVPADVTAARGRHQVALAVAAVAGARWALRTTVDYVQQRKAFGRPIATFENTRHTLGALGARITAVETYVDSCLLAASPAAAAAAKLTAGELLGEAVDLGVQLHGGYGYMWEYPIARAYAAARFFRVHGGSDAGSDTGLGAVLAAAVGL